ncbi:MAG: GTP cyclohydrolase I FolE [Thermofilum sp.]
MSNVQEGLEHSVRSLLKLLSPDYEDDLNLRETPRRFAKILEEYFKSEEEIEHEIKQLFSSIFPSSIDQLVIAKDIDVWMLCPHHLLPVNMKVNIGYLPKGFVVGYSKLHRLAKLVAKRPRLQEDYTNIVADKLMENLRPLGTMVVVLGKHLCTAMRGVRDSDSKLITSAVRGDFLRFPDLKSEFLRLLRVD